jgi:hypothetical protein
LSGLANHSKYLRKRADIVMSVPSGLSPTLAGRTASVPEHIAARLGSRNSRPPGGQIDRPSRSCETRVVDIRGRGKRCTAEVGRDKDTVLHVQGPPGGNSMKCRINSAGIAEGNERAWIKAELPQFG